MLGMLSGMVAQNSERPQVLPVYVKGVQFEMVLVQGGQYMMGCEPFYWNRIGRTDELPRHRVSLESFYMGRHEVTQQLWETVMGYNPSNFVGADNPVEQVSYYEVTQFIQKLDSITGLAFRLPTEAEWEYAARGGILSEGFTYAGSENTQEIGWTSGNSDGSTHVVGELNSNELGLFDMTGNVWEWCSDWYHPKAYWNEVMRNVLSNSKVPESVTGEDGIIDYLKANGRYPDERECFTDCNSPKGPDSGEFRVGRGGSWTDHLEDDENSLRLAYRNFWSPDSKLSVVGFRLALSEDRVPAGGWMPNQYVVDSADGKYYAVTPESLIRSTQGVLEGLFSVNEQKRVRFSRGNLQYNAVKNEYRFANRQYDIIGDDNTKCKEKYPGWIDLFAWGTSGYRDHTPYYFAMNNRYYGNGKRNIEGTHYDWGYHNPISNGGAKGKMWRTMTVNEWVFLLSRRPDAYWLNYPASIADHEGMVLLPDDWLQRYKDTIDPRVPHTYNLQEWRLLERAGAVFLPCAGYQKIGAYYYGKPINNPPAIEGITVGYGIVPPESLRPASMDAADAVPEQPLPGKGAEHSNSSQALMSHQDAGAESVHDRDFNRKAAYHESPETGALGYYWTTVHYEKDYALGFGFIYGSPGYILPFERMTRLSVRLVQDE